jgi:hypothetical protein
MSQYNGLKSQDSSIIHYVASYGDGWQVLLRKRTWRYELVSISLLLLRLDLQPIFLLQAVYTSNTNVNSPGKCKSRRPFEKCKRRWEKSIRIDLETGCQNVKWFHLARDIVLGHLSGPL